MSTFTAQATQSDFADERNPPVTRTADPLAAGERARADVDQRHFGVERVAQNRVGDAAVLQRRLRCRDDPESRSPGCRDARRRSRCRRCAARRTSSPLRWRCDAGAARRPTLSVLMRNSLSAPPRMHRAASGARRSPHIARERRARRGSDRACGFRVVRISSAGRQNLEQLLRHPAPEIA